MNFFQKISAIWQSVSLVQRALLIAIVLAIIIVGGLLTHWARRPDMRMLYQELAPEEASKITEKLSEKGTAYELRNGGTSIYAPKEKIYQLRLDMAKEGLPAGEQGGYKIFDNEKIGISPFVQKVNLKRALQEELAKSIQMIDGVVYARVHIVSTEQRLFTSQGRETSASVVLRLRAGYRLSALNIAAITHLVAGGVDGLKSENITVIDSQGRLLSSETDQTMASGASTVADYKERVEQNLANKVENMLTAVLGPGRATVKVSAVIDMNSINTVKKSYEGKGVTVDEEIKEKTTTGGSASTEGKSTGKDTDNTISTKKLFDERMETIVALPGQIKSLKVAAFVDLSPATAADANESAGAGSTNIMEVSDVQEIIKNALGLEDTSAIKVIDVKFNRPLESLSDEEISGGLDFIAIARQASLGIMAICALLVLRIFRGAKKKTGTAAAPAGQLLETEGSAGLLPAEAGKSEPLAMRKQIASALQHNPEQVKQLFASWLEEKG